MLLEHVDTRKTMANEYARMNIRIMVKKTLRKAVSMPLINIINSGKMTASLANRVTRTILRICRGVERELICIVSFLDNVTKHKKISVDINATSAVSKTNQPSCMQLDFCRKASKRT